MIIEPGLPDHWKVKEFKRLSGRSDAVEWLIRLWGACQTRKSTWYDADKPSVISSTCCFDGDPNQFVEWLLNVGVLEKETHRLTQSQNGLTQNGVGLLAVHDWEKHNAKYVANWKNGEKGGRPADQPPEPKKTQLEIGVHRRKEGIEGIERTEGEREESLPLPLTPQKSSSTKTKKRTFQSPSLSEFVAHGVARGASEQDCQEQFQIWQDGNWLDQKGNQILVWKSKLTTFITNHWMPSDRRSDPTVAKKPAGRCYKK